MKLRRKHCIASKSTFTQKPKVYTLSLNKTTSWGIERSRQNKIQKLCSKGKTDEKENRHHGQNIDR